MDLLNKTVLITGATSGIGEACAIIMAEKGAQVVLTGRNIEKGKQLATSINASKNKWGGSRVFPYGYI